MEAKMNVKSLTDGFSLSNGVKIPCIGFGTWQAADGDEAVRSVKAALAAGYRHIDTAAAYRNEKSVGLAIKESGVPRKDLFITSKLINTEHGYERAKAAIDKTLGNLGLDYLDLYLIHWPNPIAFRNNWAESNAESWRAFEEAYKAGKLRAIGVSNFHAHHLDALLKNALVKPMVNQIRLAPGDYKDEVIRASRDRGLLLEAYSPLGGTVDGLRGTNLLKAPLLQELGKKYGKSPAQLCVRWCLQQDFLPLPKSTSAEHIAANTQVFDFEISREDIEALNRMPGFPDPFPHPDETTY
jgi:diketogulonate reductase-like aldo/keto reductase